jgi:putative endonuclease
MYYIYILKLNNNKLYTGYSDNIKRRIKEHQSGKVITTSKYLPVKLIHYEAYLLKSDALRREKFLKTSDGKHFLKQQLSDLLKS